MIDEAESHPDGQASTKESDEGIEASLEVVERWVKRFDRDMGGAPEPSHTPEGADAGA